MITEEKLIKILIEGRNECYVKKSPSYNPYTKSNVYDWDFSMEIDGFIFTDSYRGFNPYSGVECIYLKKDTTPVWSCDYVGYVNKEAGLPAEEIFSFLKQARANHLQNYSNNFFSHFKFKNEILIYDTSFQRDTNSILQIENFYHGNLLVAQQISAGRLMQF